MLRLKKKEKTRARIEKKPLEWVVSTQVLDKKKVEENLQIFSTYGERILLCSEKRAIEDKLSQTIFQKINSLKSRDTFIPAVYQVYWRREYYRARDWSFIRSLAVRDICYQSRLATGATFPPLYNIALILTCRCGCNFCERWQFRDRPAPFVCTLTNARLVATAVAAAKGSIDSCNAKQSNEPCCTLLDRLDTSLETISTIHVVSERVFWCNAIHGCNCYHIVLFLLCYVFSLF